MSTNIVFDAVSYIELCSFLRKLLFKKLFRFEVIYFICITEETQISVFPLYLHVIKKQKYVM